MSYVVKIGGKRSRPLLALLTQHFFSPDFEVIFPLCNAIELFHNFTLVHDDIMDNSDLRRGSPTAHVLYSMPTAILAGDGLLVKAYQQLECYDDSIFKKLCRVFSATAYQICEGQQLDISFENTDKVSVESYLKMIELKTAVLLGASMQMVGLLNNQTDEILKSLYEIGIDIGLCFQLNDDYLDAFGTEEIGKTKGGDIVNNKKTFLYLKALELATDKDLNELKSLANEQDANHKIAATLKIYQTLQVDVLSKKLSEQYYKNALEKIAQLPFEANKKRLFLDYIYALNTRKS
jgi:geranylgeranyl diphosphate synthase type II